MSQTVQPLRIDHRQPGARAKASLREPLATLQRSAPRWITAMSILART
jgi:hypothetical protein